MRWRPACRAQDDKSAITILVGAASSMDFTARLIAEQLREALGRPAIVLASWAPASGWRWANASAPRPTAARWCSRPAGRSRSIRYIYNKLDYDPVADFTPIAGISTSTSRSPPAR